VRTTLTLDDDLAAELDRAARGSGRSFKEVVNETIRRGLSVGDRPPIPAQQVFQVEPEPCGFLPGIDPLRLNQFVDELEVERFVTGITPDGGSA
jgi:hypothetical protein